MLVMDKAQKRQATYSYVCTRTIVINKDALVQVILSIITTILHSIFDIQFQKSTCL